MPSALLVGVLTYGHILSAIGWLGAVLTINLTLGPLMGRFAPSTRAELLRQFLPRFVRVTESFAGSTVVFGLGLYAVLSPGSSSSWHLTVGIGIAIAAVAFVSGLVLIVPVSRRLSRLAEDRVDQPAAPAPPELGRLVRRLQAASFASMLLLLAVLVFMVSAAQV